MVTRTSMAKQRVTPSKYGPRKGLDGPFFYPTGHVLYYDPAEELYWNPTNDFYLSHDESDEILSQLFDRLRA